MARISLRAYNREIESWIERGQIDQAIAHCRHILKYYPKHVDTYRLLGKAYLESRRYSDAADILQRVLSSVPEDFVAHVGMSIIREDEGNLDEAIWHMERAFEMQPANNAIQEELRRLYGRRDGLEPPKVRLTRGALARMYAKGDLYQQAISELRAALAEDPERLDLQALLANVYMRSGHRAEAAEACNTILRKLPYCLEANRVMAEVLANSERVSETQPYLSRVQALDPYAAHLSPATKTIQNVPDQTVTIEKLTWKPGQPIGGGPDQPEWAASLGVEIASLKPSDETLPDWLAAPAEEISSTDAKATPESSIEASPATEFPWEDTSETDLSDWLPEEEVEPAQPADESEIPDWMKEAGWTGAAETGEERPVEAAGMQVEGELDLGTEESGELVEADIPDWLRAMAPSEAHEDIDIEAGAEDLAWLQEEEPSEELPGWLKEPKSEPDLAAEAEDAQEMGDVTAEAEEVELEDLIPGEEGAPDTGEAADEWLQMSEVEEPTPPVEIAGAPETEQEEMPEEDMPAWLRDALASDEAATEMDESLLEGADQQAADEAIPEWLQELDADSGVEINATDEWELALDQLETEDLEEGEAEPAETIPEWLQAMEEAAPTAGEIEGEPQEEVQFAETEQEPPELAELEVEGTQPRQEAETPQPDETPDLEDEDAAFAWLESLAVKQGAEEALLLTPEERKEAPPDWVLEEEVEAEEAALVEEEEAPVVDFEQEEPSVYEPELAEQAEAPVEAEAEELEAMPTQEVPDWLPEAESTAQDFAEPVEVQEEPSEEHEPEGEPAFDLEDEEASFAWLESLAVKQGAEEALLLTPEERQETPPEWVQEAVSAEEEAEGQVEGELELEQEAESQVVEAEAAAEPELEEGYEEAAEEMAAVEAAEAIQQEETAAEEAVEQVPDMEEEIAFAEEDTKPVRVAPPEERAVEEAAAEQAEEPAGEFSMEQKPVEETAVLEPTSEAVTTEEVEELEEVEQAPEMPEWLRELAREEALSEGEVAAEEESIPPFAETVETSEMGAWEAEPPEQEEAVPELPGWLAEAAEGEPEEEVWIPPEEPVRKLNLNEASLSELERLPDIGFILAQSIIAYRETFGPFTDIDDLRNVSGIGPTTIDEIQNFVFVETPQEPEEALLEVDQDAPEEVKQARSQLNQGNVEEAVQHYSELINSQQYLDEVIHDLKLALSQYPVEVSVWQTLGDAYLRTNQIQDALDAFTKAEELLR